MITLPANIDLVALVKKAFDLSSPQGMGYLHHTPLPMPNSLAKEILANGHGSVVFSMAYVRGRAVKFTVHRLPNGDLIAPARWFDHTIGDYIELLGAFNIPEQTILDANVQDTRAVG